MITSMTGFASRNGSFTPFAWAWELRAVNGKGLDLRVRAPDWIDGLEAGLRKQLAARLTRGNVTCNLRITKEEGGSTLVVNDDQLQLVLEALHQIEQAAMDRGLSLAPSKATDIVTMRGVLEQSGNTEDTAALCRTLLTDFETVLDDFDSMRRAEGRALAEVLQGQLNSVESLTTEAVTAAETRKDEMAKTLRRNLTRVLENSERADEARVAQELAMIAVKADITEEIDRLRAHVEAAQALLDKGGAVGRKLDFLMQEFNREANTLCAKAQSAELTRIGLALKAVIDQMREQVQNVE